MSISEDDFRGVDLNLMVAFMVLMRERSVSRAAACLFIGQPAMSGALARLRQLFGDELLVRSAQGMEPTTRAHALAAAIGPAVAQLQRALFVPPVFDPAGATRQFTIGMPDWVESWLMPALIARMLALAPGCRLALRDSDPFSTGDMLDQDRIELGVASVGTGAQRMHARTLREMGYRCVYDPQMVALDGPLTLARYAALPHVLVSYRGAFESAADTVLAAQGLRRNVCYTTPRFASVPGIVQRSALVATVPEVLARRWEADGRLASCAVPLDLRRFTVSLVWHARHDGDVALQWLMRQIEEVALEPEPGAP